MKTLVMKWTETFEWRVAISDDFGGNIKAIDQAMSQSGILAHSRPNIDPESLHFEIVEE